MKQKGNHNKTIGIILIVLMLLISNQGKSQYIADTTGFFTGEKIYNDLLKIQPMQAIWGYSPFTSEFLASIEIKTLTQQSFTFGAGYLTKNWMLSFQQQGGGPPDIIIDGFRVFAGYRLYLTNLRRQPSGLYVSPVFGYGETIYDTGSRHPRTDYIKVRKHDISIASGLQFLIGRFGFDAQLIVGRKNETWTEHQTPSSSIPIKSPFISENNPFLFLRMACGFNLIYCL